MVDFRKLAIFAAVVEQGSFTAAAQILGMTKSGVSKQVTALEAMHGVQLLHRTTRSLHVTESGELLYRHAADMIAAAQSGVAAIAERAEQPRGSLRVTAPIGIGESFLAPRLGPFTRQHPDIELTLHLTDSQQGILDQGFDLAIRAAPLADSSMVVRKLTEVPLVLCGSPRFVRAHAPIKRPADLARVQAIVFTPLGKPMKLELRRENARRTVSMGGQIATNHGPVALRLALEDSGLAVLPRFYIEEHLRDGNLVTVLDDWSVGAVPVFAVYPSKRVTAATRALLAFLVDVVDTTR